MCGVVVDWEGGGGREEVQQEYRREGFKLVALLGEIILNGYLLFTSRVCQNSRGLFVPWYFVPTIYQVLYR
jgi:hypothetical protein